jgi:hypothetical protein
MTIDERDRVVARALRRLATPEHGPEFWAELDARLAGVNEPTRATVPDAVVTAVDDAPVIELRPAEGRERSTRRKTLRWTRIGPVAAAAAIIAVFAGVLGTRDGGDDTNRRIVLAAPPETTVAPAAPDSSAATSQPAPQGSAGVDTNDVAQRAAVGFIDALSTGDMKTAWDMLGPASRDTWQSYNAFNAARSGFSEGLGTWASATNRTVSTTTVLVDDKTGDSLHVVTFTGERRPEGMPTSDPYAMVVRVKAAGGVEAEPFTPHDTIGLRFVSPPKGDTPARVAANATISVELPAGYRSIAFVVDGDAVSEGLGRGDAQNGSRASYSAPSGGWAKGRQVVSAFAIYGDGTPAATAVMFEVA